MAKREKGAGRAGGGERVTPEGSFDEIVALLRRSWTEPQALATGAGNAPRSSLDRLTIEDAAFRSFGR